MATKYEIMVSAILDKANMQEQLDSLVVKNKPNIKVGIVVNQDALDQLQEKIKAIESSVGGAVKYNINTSVDADGAKQITSATLTYVDALKNAKRETYELVAGEEKQVEWMLTAVQYTDDEIAREKMLGAEKERQIALEQNQEVQLYRLQQQKILEEEKNADYLRKLNEEGFREQQANNIKIAEQEAISLTKRNAAIETTKINLERMAATSSKAFNSPEVQSSVAALKRLEDGYRNGTVSQTEYSLATKKVNSDLAIQNNAINTVNKSGMDLFNMFELAAKKVAIWFSATTLIFGSIREFGKMTQYVQDLNKELTSLQIVTNMTGKDSEFVARGYNDLAQAMGATTLEVAKGSLEWARQGKTVSETQELLKATLSMSKLGNMEAAQSTEYLTSTLNGFKMEASDAMGVVDVLTNLDNNYATSVSEIADGLSRSSNSAQQAGVSFQELSSYITIVSSVTRKSAESIGESFPR